MPTSEKQRKAACARAHGSGNVMKSMSKAKEWCRGPIHQNGRDRMTRRNK